MICGGMSMNAARGRRVYVEKYLPGELATPRSRGPRLPGEV